MSPSTPATQLQSLIFSGGTFALGNTSRTTHHSAAGPAELIIADPITGSSSATSGITKLGGVTSATVGFVQGNLVLDSASNSYTFGTLINQGTVWARNGNTGTNLATNSITLSPTSRHHPDRHPPLDGRGPRLEPDDCCQCRRRRQPRRMCPSSPSVSITSAARSPRSPPAVPRPCSRWMAFTTAPPGVTTPGLGNQTFTTTISEAGLTTAGNWILGATADNATYAPSAALTAGAGSTYRLGAGGGVLTISDANVANVLTGPNSLLIGGNNSATATVGATGVVLITGAQTFQGATAASAVTINAGGTLTVLGNTSLGTAANGLTLIGGTLDLREASTTFGSTDTQYSARKITLTGSSAINADRFNGGLYGTIELGTLASGTFTLTASLSDNTNLKFDGATTLTGNLNITVTNANTAVIFGGAIDGGLAR